MNALLSRHRTLLLDMDGTLLDLAYDNFFWLRTLPEFLSQKRSVSVAEAEQTVFALIESERGTLNWYDLDFWSDALGVDMLAIKRACPEPIRFIDGAAAFLTRARDAGHELVLVTNSSPPLLALKQEATGVLDYMDRAYSSAEFKAPKESQQFWTRFFAHDPAVPGDCLLLDDSESVLQAAETFGVSATIGIRHPDTGRESNALPGRVAVDYVRELLL
ncbi:MAG: HAD family hydrolase [Pseudomonadota bacterium]